MGLREMAESALSYILEDATNGFGWPITVTDPNGTSGNFVGFSTDISESIDPSTGTVVSGRLAGMSLRISSLTAAGLGIPVAIVDVGRKPWVVQFDDIGGQAYVFKVRKSKPDRVLGIVTCELEAYIQ